MEISIELLIIMVKTICPFYHPWLTEWDQFSYHQKKKVMTFWGISDDILTLWDHQRKIWENGWICPEHSWLAEDDFILAGAVFPSTFGHQQKAKNSPSRPKLVQRGCAGVGPLPQLLFDRPWLDNHWISRALSSSLWWATYTVWGHLVKGCMPDTLW